MESVISDLMIFMGERGILYKESEFESTVSYIRNMIKDNRVIVIYKSGDIHTVLFFSISNDWRKHYLKETWEYRSHDPYGAEIYFEKAVSVRWSRAIRCEVKGELLRRFPSLRLAKWHRYDTIGDRECTLKRGAKTCLTSN